MFGHASFDIADYFVRVVPITKGCAKLIEVGLKQVVCVLIYLKIRPSMFTENDFFIYFCF